MTPEDLKKMLSKMQTEDAAPKLTTCPHCGVALELRVAEKKKESGDVNDE